ncbi:MAG: transposase, partial [Planctomycetaceae bacterium]|nr:transposase [Planctomycetaceae bacterium]
ELRNHVREKLAQPDGVVVIDPSAFPKKGTESCGVGRQWCGRLGKVEPPRLGLFLRNGPGTAPGSILGRGSGGGAGGAAAAGDAPKVHR